MKIQKKTLIALWLNSVNTLFLVDGTEMNRLSFQRTNRYIVQTRGMEGIGIRDVGRIGI